MVFQNYALYPNMNVYKNIAFPLKMIGESKDVIDKKVNEIASILKIATAAIKVFFIFFGFVSCGVSMIS